MVNEKEAGVEKWHWPTFLKKNSLFLGAVLVLILLGGFLLSQIDYGDAIFYFSERRRDWANIFFKYGTKLGEEYVYILALIALLFIRYRYALAIPLVGLTVTLVSYYLKSYFAHARPSLYFQQEGLFDQLNLIVGVSLYGGHTSFPSGHTMSAFAFYAFLAFCFSRSKSLSLTFLLLALLVGISRIYLMQHFLQDVYLGAIIGTMIGILWYYLIFLLPKRYTWLDKSLLNR